MNKTLEYGIVGCGGFGLTHLEGLTLLHGVKITALCDIHMEKCEELKEKFDLVNAKCYTDYKEMLADKKFDIVVVATSDQTHREITVAALEAGANVMCEKPMALFLEECVEMNKAAERTGKVLMVGQICRFTPGFVKAKEIIESGLIGELTYVESEYAHDYVNTRGRDDWRVNPDREPVIGGACHAIDLLRWLAGDPSETTAYSNHKMLPDWPVNDTTVAIFKFPDDVIGRVFTSISCKRDYTMRTVLYGTKGTIIVDNTSPTLELFLDKSVKEGNFADGYFGDSSDRSIKHSIIVEINNHNTEGEHKMMREKLLEDKPLITTGLEGAKTVAVCRAVVESAKTGMPVKINYNF